MLPTVFNTLLALCCGYALLCGGAPERSAALIAVLGSLATLATGHHHFTRVAADVLMIDLAVYAGFQLLALWADRFWPTVIAGLQMTSILMHFATGAMPTFIPFAYALAIWAWSYLIVALIGIGTWRHRRRLSLYGWDRDWSARHPGFTGVSARG